MSIFPKRIIIAGIQQGFFKFLGENDKAGGVEGTLLNLIADTLKFGYKLVTPADKVWGSPTDDGNWTGMIGMVKRDEADWAMTAITVTDVRKAVVDFSEPYTYTEYSFATDLPSEKSRLYTYLYPFDLETWSGILAVMVIFPVVIAKMHRLNLSYPTLFFLISGNLLRQDLFNRRTKNAYGVGWWCLIASVFSTSYTAVIASFLTQPLYESSVKTWKELSDAVVKGEYAAIVPKGGGNHLFRSSKEHLIRIAQAIEKNGWRMDFEGSKVEENKKLSRFKIALVLPRMALYYKFGKPPLSSKFVSMDNILSLDIAIAMSKKFCCKGDVDDLIVKIKKAGIYDKILDHDLFKIWIRSQKNESMASHERPMSFGDLSGAFLILGCGHLLAVVSFLLEKFSRRRKN